MVEGTIDGLKERQNEGINEGFEIDGVGLGY
jgi:hypothetical protein